MEILDPLDTTIDEAKGAREVLLAEDIGTMEPVRRVSRGLVEIAIARAEQAADRMVDLARDLAEQQAIYDEAKADLAAILLLVK